MKFYLCYILMAKRVELYNLPYRPSLAISKEKIDSLFSLINLMDTQQIKQFSMIHNVPLNVYDINGENLIHKVISIENILKKEFHRLNIIKFLVQNDVNPDKPNKENQTPLHLACKMQYADIVKYLITLDVNVNYQDNYGATPFHYALQGQFKLLELDKNIKKDDSLNKDFLNYEFLKVEEPVNDKFIIYPDEYSNTEILKLKYELIIKEDIYNSLLKYKCNPYILDSNSQSPIFPLLKTHVPYILLKLKEQGLDYREFTKVLPYNFLISELRNHIHKLTNNSNNYHEWINNFVLYQKNEVKILILSNEKFGNNIPLYLEDSFNIISYITNQYLSESTLSDSNNNYLFINEIIGELMYDDENDNILLNKIENMRKDIKNLEKKKESNIDIINDLSNTIFTVLNTHEFSNKYQKKLLDNADILDRYIQFCPSIGNSTMLLSKFINMNLNDSDDLLTFKQINKILDMKNLPEVNEFYKKTNKISNTYFTFGNYTDNNKVSKFSKKLLEFMTIRFICYPYFKLLQNIISNLKIEALIDIFNTTIIYNQYQEVSAKLVKNTVHIFDNQDDELKFSFESSKITLDDVVKLLKIEDLKIDGMSEDAIKIIDNLLNTIKEINSYFDTFINKTILNWLVVIENVFKFDINQGRIVECIYNLQT